MFVTEAEGWREEGNEAKVPMVIVPFEHNRQRSTKPSLIPNQTAVVVSTRMNGMHLVRRLKEKTLQYQPWA